MTSRAATQSALDAIRSDLADGWTKSRFGFETWVRARLGWRALRAEEYVDEGFAFLSTPNIKGKQIEFSFVNFISLERYEESPEIQLQIGDVLLAKDGSTLGAVNVVRQLPCPTTVNSSIAVITPGPNVDSIFLYYSLQGAMLKSFIEEYKAGMGVPHLFQDDIRRFPLLLPTIVLQRRIAEYLDVQTAKIDALIGKQEQLIETLRERRQAVISHAVTKGLDPNATLRNSGVKWLGEVPASWSVGRMGYETWVRARLGWKGLTADEYVDEGFAFLATPNIKTSVIDFENVNYISLARYEESPEIKLKSGDVLLAKDGSTLGTVNVVRDLPREATVNGSIAVLTPSPTLQPEFLYYFLQSSYVRNLIQALKGGAGVPHLFQDDIRRFAVCLPTIKEQREIVGYLDHETAQIDALSAKTREMIDVLKERRQALISAAVTGKIEVRAATAS